MKPKAELVSGLTTVGVSVPYIAGSAVKPSFAGLVTCGSVCFSPLHRGERSEARVDGLHPADEGEVSVPYIAGSAVKLAGVSLVMKLIDRFSPLHRGERSEAGERVVTLDC